MTTAARAVCGRFLEQVGREHQQQCDSERTHDPVSWVLAPAASATGVREELLLIGKP
jgi:hypothetical protein